MFSLENVLVALAVFAHYFATVTAAPKPVSIEDVIDGVGELLNDSFVMDLMSNDQNALESAAVSSPATAFSAALLPDFLYFAEFSGAAYCGAKLVVGTEVVCSDNICPTISTNTVTTIAEFDNTKNTDTTGFVALDDTTKSIVISFRGSSSLRNWLANIQILLKDVPEYCAGCKIHTGFHEAFLEGFPSVFAAFNGLKAAHPGYKIVVTGHSLGGAIATITATELRRQGNVVELFTYGAPRVGNREFSVFITNSGENFRVTHTDNPVPRLPPVSFGYEHVSPEYHIVRGDSNIKPTDITVLQGGVNLGGNSGGSLISLDILAHLHYFLPVIISECGGLFKFDFING